MGHQEGESAADGQRTEPAPETAEYPSSDDGRGDDTHHEHSKLLKGTDQDNLRPVFAGKEILFVEGLEDSEGLRCTQSDISQSLEGGGLAMLKPLSRVSTLMSSNED